MKLCHRIEFTRAHCSATQLEASVVQWLCHSPCKLGVAGSIPGFFQSVGWDYKPRSRLHMTLAVGGTLNPNQPTPSLSTKKCPWKRGFIKILKKMSRPMGKPTICIGENKDADQLRGSREADQRLCFRYSDSTVPPLLNSKISSF